MSITNVSCPHCHTLLIEKIAYKSTLHAVLKNGILGTLTLKDNATEQGTKTLENYRCTQCGMTFNSPPLLLDTSKNLILN